MGSSFRLATYQDVHGTPQPGVIVGDRIFPAGPAIGGWPSVLDILADWRLAEPRLANWAETAESSAIPLAGARLLAPIQYPANFFCAGANYWDHLEEMSELITRMVGRAPPAEKLAEPWFFVRTTRGTIVGDGAKVAIPKFTRQVDWEAELGVVIGVESRDLTEADAFSAVAGYVIINDLSARDHVRREGSPFIYDWVGQKCWDGSAPMGPITPARFVKDPQDLAIELKVNGVVKQSSNTRLMVHSVAEQVAYLSRHVTLYPGDVIATGTPAGVGMPRGEFLSAGDEVRVEIAGLGTLTTQMVA